MRYRYAVQPDNAKASVEGVTANRTGLSGKELLAIGKRRSGSASRNVSKDGDPNLQSDAAKLRRRVDNAITKLEGERGSSSSDQGLHSIMLMEERGRQREMEARGELYELENRRREERQERQEQRERERVEREERREEREREREERREREREKREAEREERREERAMKHDMMMMQMMMALTGSAHKRGDDKGEGS